MDTDKLRELSADVILQECFLEEYRKGMDHIHNELVELNAIILIAERIIDFPFDLLVPLEKQVFFTIVMWSLYHSAILIITKLASDQKGDLFTISQFRNNISKNIKEEFKEEFFNRLRQSKFDAEVRDLLTKARDLRDSFIAHSPREYVLREANLSFINISNIKLLRDALNNLHDTLSFDTEYMKLPLHYFSSTQDQYEKNLDIDDILDCLARNSQLLNLPKNNPEVWKYQKENLSEQILEKINEYRRKFNLPEI